MEKHSQKQLITEIMNEDAQAGLYKQQTAVEWLKQKLLLLPKPIYNSEIEKYFDQAKQMHREQIEKANIAGMEFIPVDPNRYESDASDYYTQTYGE